MPYFHACIFANYNDVSGVITRWEEKCVSILVVEHPAEGKTQRIHCHILIESSSGEDWFRNSAKEVMGEYIKRGNYWIATRVQKGEHAGKLIAREPSMIYMLKGKHAVKFAKNFSPAELEAAKEAWVESTLENDKSSEGLADVMIKIVLNRYSQYKSRQDYIEHYRNLLMGGEIHHSNADYAKFLFSEVRSSTMRAYWHKNRKAPFPAQYKIVAASVFLALAERFNFLDNGFDELKNSWY